jgi:hypothetical protein
MTWGTKGGCVGREMGISWDSQDGWVARYHKGQGPGTAQSVIRKQHSHCLNLCIPVLHASIIYHCISLPPNSGFKQHQFIIPYSSWSGTLTRMQLRYQRDFKAQFGIHLFHAHLCGCRLTLEDPLPSLLNVCWQDSSPYWWQETFLAISFSIGYSQHGNLLPPRARYLREREREMEVGLLLT